MSLVYVDRTKSDRADFIVGLLKGTILPKDLEQESTLKKFKLLAEENKVDEKDYKEFVYSKLGGLVRTDEEHAVSEERRKKLDKEYKKNKDKLDEEHENV